MQQNKAWPKNLLIRYMYKIGSDNKRLELKGLDQMQRILKNSNQQGYNSVSFCRFWASQ